MQLHTFTNIRLITMREFKSRLTRRSVIINTVLGLILGLVAALLPTGYFVAQNRQNVQNTAPISATTPPPFTPTRIVVLNNAGNIAGQNTDDLIYYLQNNINANVPAGNIIPPLSGYPTIAPGYADYLISKANTNDKAELLKQLNSGQFEVALILERGKDGEVQLAYHARLQDSDSSEYLRGSLQYALDYLVMRDRLLRQGFSLDQQGQAFSPLDLPDIDATPTPAVTPHPTTNTATINTTPAISAAKLKSDLTTTFAKATASPTFALAEVLLTYLTMLVSSYGPLIAHGVVEEKSSRVVEIMISAATPTQLLMGKLAGIALLALVQVGTEIILLTLGIAAQAPIAHLLVKHSHIETNWSALAAIGISSLYMVAAFFFYGSLYAALAAPQSRPDEVQRTLIPLSFVMLPNITLGYASLVFGQETWLRILSFFPMFSPYMMIARTASGNINWLDLLLGLIINIVSTALVVKFAAHIYRKVLLYYGKRLNLWQLLRYGN